MKNHLVVSSVTWVTAFASLALTTLALIGLPLSAQVAPGQAVPARSAIPRQSDGKPDFTGVWLIAKVLQHNTESKGLGEGPDRRSCFLVFLPPIHKALVCWSPCVL